MRVVVDTNVFVSAVMSSQGASREVIRQCLIGELHPLMGNALFSEFEDVCARGNLFEPRMISAKDISTLLDAFMSCCNWVPIYYLWRPNLPDEADNHVLELALAGGAAAIITQNKRDFKFGELRFEDLEILTPYEYLKRKRAPT